MSITAERVKDYLLADNAVSALVGTDGFVGHFPGLPALPGFSVNEEGIDTSAWPLSRASITLEIYAATSVVGQAAHQAILAALQGEAGDAVARQAAWQAKGIVAVEVGGGGGPYQDQDAPDWGKWVFYRLDAEVTIANPAAE